MSATEQICKESEYPDESHHWEHVDTFNPYSQCMIYYYKCRFCGAKKRIAIDPDEPFDIGNYWEAYE